VADPGVTRPIGIAIDLYKVSIFPRTSCTCSLRIPRRNVEQYPLRLPMSIVEPIHLRTRLQMSRNERNHEINVLAIGNWRLICPLMLPRSVMLPEPRDITRGVIKNRTNGREKSQEITTQVFI